MQCQEYFLIVKFILPPLTVCILAVYTFCANAHGFHTETRSFRVKTLRPDFCRNGSEIFFKININVVVKSKIISSLAEFCSPNAKTEKHF